MNMKPGTYKYDELKALTDKEFVIDKVVTEIRVGNMYVYDICKFKIRGERGMSIFIDFYDSNNKITTTLSVFNQAKLFFSDSHNFIEFVVVNELDY